MGERGRCDEEETGTLTDRQMDGHIGRERNEKKSGKEESDERENENDWKGHSRLNFVRQQQQRSEEKKQKKTRWRI